MRRTTRGPSERTRLLAWLRQAAPNPSAPLAPEEVDRLALRAQAGSTQAEATLLGLFAEFIVNSASKRVGKESARLGDIVQENVEALRRAIQGFRPGRRFENYAK
jgi:hypothetical protein